MNINTFTYKLTSSIRTLSMFYKVIVDDSWDFTVNAEEPKDVIDVLLKADNWNSQWVMQIIQHDEDFDDITSESSRMFRTNGILYETYYPDMCPIYKDFISGKRDIILTILNRLFKNNNRFRIEAVSGSTIKSASKR